MITTTCLFYYFFSVCLLQDDFSFKKLCKDNNNRALTEGICLLLAYSSGIPYLLFTLKEKLKHTGKSLSLSLYIIMGCYNIFYIGFFFNLNTCFFYIFLKNYFCCFYFFNIKMVENLIFIFNFYFIFL